VVLSTIHSSCNLPPQKGVVLNAPLLYVTQLSLAFSSEDVTCHKGVCLGTIFVLTTSVHSKDPRRETETETPARLHFCERHKRCRKCNSEFLLLAKLYGPGTVTKLACCISYTRVLYTYVRLNNSRTFHDPSSSSWCFIWNPSRLKWLFVGEPIKSDSQTDEVFCESRILTEDA
jgi:hypothetical protein